uniref:Late blight resistance protein homolog R1B-14 n=1 Tax=Nicotiana tabacum TaxID=4097 RepID=A0A1S4BPU5_TOBAC|nr:PREDICTED: putative late blight resistance protein homolog R1B-14 [Nicotiana tabacum]
MYFCSAKGYDNDDGVAAVADDNGDEGDNEEEEDDSTFEMSSNRYLSSKNRLFERLQQLDDILYLPDTTKDTVRFVKREFKFLDIFLSLQSYTDECPNMLDVVQKVQALFEDALFDFSELHLAEYFDLCPFIVQNKIWLIKMEIRAKYSFPKISSLPFSANKDGIAAILNFFTKFIDTVVENLCDLVDDSCSLVYVPENKEHTEDVLKELKLVQYFVCFVSEPQSQYHVSFFAHVLAVVGHASMLAWLYLSGRDVVVLEYPRKNLLLVILCDVIGKDSKSRESCGDHELADELRRVLLSKRYLVLLDDVWEASAWDDLIGCFQDTNNGSRIIVTTRNNEVANYARFRSDPLSLRMFSDDESWELLRKKVFGEERCSPLLNNIGQRIAKKSGRLPLSVALVAGILADTEKKEECWEQVANNLVPHIHGDSRAIIEHRYGILPYHINLCFLYFGAVLEDSVINVLKLTRMWISE